MHGYQNQIVIPATKYMPAEGSGSVWHLFHANLLHLGPNLVLHNLNQNN
jgi:hypothetical protein